MKIFLRLYFIMFTLLLLLSTKSLAQPNNDNCREDMVGLIPITAYGWSLSYRGDVTTATQSLAPNQTCIGPRITNRANDVWFHFRAFSTSATIEVSPTSAASSSIDPGVEVFSGSCSSLSSITCYDNGGGNGDPESFTRNDYIVGNNYYIRVFHFTASDGVPSPGTFDIRINSIGSSPVVPVITATTGAIGCINVSWSSVSSATSYELYKDGVSVGRINGTSTTSCNLAEGSNHCYKVRACTGTQCSAFSNIDCANAGQRTVVNYNINATATTGGSIVSGTGTYEADDEATLVASQNAGYSFAGWFENNDPNPVSTDLRYTFIVSGNRTLVARFKYIVTFMVSFEAAPWQRLNDDYNAKFTVTTSNASSYKLYCKLGNNPEIVFGPFSSGVSYTQAIRFNETTSNNPGTVTYRVAVGTDSKNIADKTTSIIERFWPENSFCVDNSANSAFIDIPIKYLESAGSYNISFKRDDKVSNVNAVPWTFENINLDYIWKNLVIVNNKYRIEVGNNPIIHPGKFSFTISYRNSMGQLITNEQQKGTFFLTKIGKISNGNAPQRTSKILVVVGGWTNTIEDNVKDSENGYNGGNTFSVANYFARQNYNVWYIAHPNNDYVENNGYALGKALEKIKELTSATDIHIICHSKGGLDLRTMLSNKAQIKDYAASLFPFNFNFDGSILNGSLKSITFLATPHNGAAFTGSIAAGLASITTQSRGVSDLAPSAVASKFKNYTVPTGINFLNFTGYNYIFIPGVHILEETDGAVTFGSSEHPSLKLRDERSRPNVLQDYVKATHLNIHKTEKLNTPQYKCNAVPFETIRRFIEGLSLDNCNRPTTHFDIIGSFISNASVEIKDTVFSTIGYTDEKGVLRNVTPIYPTTGDTIRVSAVGYDTLISAIENRGDNTFHILMFKSTTVGNKMMYPKVEIQNYSTFTTDTRVTFKVTAKNMLSYQIWNMADSATTFRQLTVNDSVITAPLPIIDNYYNIRLIGATDTIDWVKYILRLPSDSLSDYTYKANFQFAPTQLGASLYIENRFIKTIDRLVDSFRLLNVHYKISLSQFGYQDTTFWLNGVDTSISLQLPLRYRYTLQDSNIINFNTLGKVQYWNGITVKNNAANGLLSLKRYDFDYSNLRLITQSETFSYNSLTPSVSILKTGFILDVPNPPQKDSIYLLKIGNNNTYTKLFSPQFEYEEPFQKVILDSLILNNEAKLVLMKKQKPIKNTSTGFRVHQSETFTIPFADLFKDPDALPNDMTYSITPNNNFDYKILNDSITIRHKSCNVGKLSFQVTAKHDQLTVIDTFTIQVTPLSITSTVRPARCFGTETGRIQVSISSTKPQLYKFIWSNALRTSTIDSIKADAYKVTVSDANNCTLLKTINVQEPTEVSVNLGIDVKLDLGDSIELAPIVNRSLMQSWKWIPSDGLSCANCERPFAKPLQTTIYRLLATDTAGCLGRDTLKINVTNKRKVFIPTAFSPNNDGNNDIFMVYGGNEVRKINKFQVYSRWGSRVFAIENVLPNDPSKGWDGLFQGQAAEMGSIFIYAVEVEYINGKIEVFSGDVTIVR